MKKNRDIKLGYYSHLSRLVNTYTVLAISTTLGWLAYLYVCSDVRNIAFKSGMLGFVVGFTLSIVSIFTLLASYSFAFVLYLVELDLGIRNYIDNLIFPTWMGWFSQRRKKLLYLRMSDVVALSIFIGFYLISSWYVFGLTLFIPLLIFVVVGIIGSITNLKKAIKEKPKIFSKVQKVANP